MPADAGYSPDDPLTVGCDIAGYSGAPSPPETKNAKELEAVVRALDCERVARVSLVCCREPVTSRPRGLPRSFPRSLATSGVVQGYLAGDWSGPIRWVTRLRSLARSRCGGSVPEVSLWW